VATPRKEREKAHARWDILRAAATAFASRGYHGTTIEDVAREAGYSPSSLYTHFKGKSDIYESLLRAVAAEFRALQAEPPIASLAFPERLEWLIRGQLDLVEKNREFFIVFAAQRGGIEWVAGNDINDLARTNYLRWVEFMAGLLAKGMEEGAVRQTDARDLAYFVVGSINAAVFRWVAGDVRGPLKDQATPLLSFIRAGIGMPSTEGGA